MGRGFPSGVTDGQWTRLERGGARGTRAGKTEATLEFPPSTVRARGGADQGRRRQPTALSGATGDRSVRVAILTMEAGNVALCTWSTHDFPRRLQRVRRAAPGTRGGFDARDSINPDQFRSIGVHLGRARKSADGRREGEGKDVFSPQSFRVKPALHCQSACVLLGSLAPLAPSRWRPCLLLPRRPQAPFPRLAHEA